MSDDDNKFDLLTEDELIACPHCDLLLQRLPLKEGQKATCPRCGTFLEARKKDSIQRTFAVSLAGLIAIFPAVYLPLLGLQVAGFESEASLLDCVRVMITNDLAMVAALVVLFCITFPLIRLTIICYLSGQILLGNRTRNFNLRLFRVFHDVEEWGMLEVFLLGLVVSLYKILGLADAVFGLGLIAFILLLVSATLVTYFLDEQLVWDKLSESN